MQQHDDHHSKATHLAELARAAGITALVQAASQHALHSRAAAAAYATGDIHKKAAATADLMRSAADILSVAAGVTDPSPEIIKATQDTIITLADGLKASI